MRARISPLHGPHHHTAVTRAKPPAAEAVQNLPGKHAGKPPQHPKGLHSGFDTAVLVDCWNCSRAAGASFAALCVSCCPHTPSSLHLDLTGLSAHRALYQLETRCFCAGHYGRACRVCVDRLHPGRGAPRSPASKYTSKGRQLAPASRPLPTAIVAVCDVS